MSQSKTLRTPYPKNEDRAKRHLERAAREEMSQNMIANKIDIVEPNIRPNTETADREGLTSVVTLEDAGIPVEMRRSRRYPPPLPLPRRREFAVSRFVRPKLTLAVAPSNITSAPRVENANDGLSFGFFAPNDHVGGPYADRYRSVSRTARRDRVIFDQPSQDGCGSLLESSSFVDLAHCGMNWSDTLLTRRSSYASAARLYDSRIMYGEWQSTQPSTEPRHSLYSEPQSAKVESELTVPRLRSPFPWTEKDSRLDRDMQDATGELYQQFSDTLLDSAWGGKGGRMRYAKGGNLCKCGVDSGGVFGA